MLVNRLQARIDALAALYLIVPLALFFGNTFSLLPAIVLVGLIVLGAVPLVRTCWKQPNTSVFGWKTVLVILAVACGWALFSGAGHVLFANSDWQKHDGILEDLQHYQWPVTYESSSSVGDLLLRYYMGFHVVPAFFAKVFGGLNFWVFAWEAIGTFLVLMLLLRRISTSLGRLLACVAFLAFGGLDIVGYIWMHGTSNLTPHQFLENWSIAQYSSNATLLAWVPNHALAAWLALLLFKDRSTDPKFLLGVPVLLAAVAFWSVFVAIGLLPFVFVPLARAVWNSRGRFIVNPSVLAGVVMGLLTTAYLVSGASDGNRQGFLWDIYPNSDVMFRAASLIVLDVLVLVAALLFTRVRFETWTWAAVALLCLFPFYVIGIASSDFTMRSSIPAQLVLFLQICVVIETRTRRDVVISEQRKAGAHARPKGRGTWRFLPLVLVLLVGSGEAVTTWARAVQSPPWGLAFNPVAPSKLLSVVGINGGPPDSQYLVSAPGWMSWAMRHHQSVFSSTEVMNGQTRWMVSTSDPGTGAFVRQSADGVTFSTRSQGSMAAITDRALTPGIYKIRARLTVDPAHAPGFNVLGVLEQNKVSLTATASPYVWLSDDYFSVFDTSAPLVFQIINAPDAGAVVTMSDLTVERVSPR